MNNRELQGGRARLQYCDNDDPKGVPTSFELIQWNFERRYQPQTAIGIDCSPFSSSHFPKNGLDFLLQSLNRQSSAPKTVFKTSFSDLFLASRFLETENAKKKSTSIYLSRFSNSILSKFTNTISSIKS